MDDPTPLLPLRPDVERPLPRLLGRYEVRGLLGEGGMGAVYAAHDPELGRDVALKVLRPRAGDATRTRRWHERLLLEAQTMARLAHPNVVAVHDVGTLDGRVFFAMELVRGQTLRAWMAAGPHPWREVLRVLCDAGRGLAAAHAAGLVHRDFKPDNVLVGDDGRIRVTDFGIASTGDAAAPGAGDLPPDAVLGTPRYLPPEVSDGAPPTPLSDQFSFCVTAWESLFGPLPDWAITRARRARGAPEPAGPTGPLAPASVRRALERGLEAAPSARHASMDALLARLGAPLDPGRRARVWTAVALGAVAVAAGVAITSLRAQRAHLCAPDEHRFDGIWDAQRRAAVERGLAADPRPFVRDVWTRLHPRLDGYVAQWKGASEDACRAARVRRSQTEVQLGLRTECLDSAARHLAAFTDLLGSGRPGVADRALEGADRLPRLEDCSDLGALAAGAPPPDPARRAEVTAVRTLLARAEARRSLGQYADARTLLADAPQAAERTGYAPVRAEALLERALVTRLADPSAALGETEEASLAAFAAGDDRQLARAWVEGLRTAARQGTPAAVATWSARASAAVDRFPTDDALRLKKRIGDAAIQFESGKLVDALATLDACDALAARVYPPGSAGRLEVDLLRQAVLVATGNNRTTLPALTEVVKRLEAALGPAHPGVATALAYLAYAETAMGRGKDALAHTTRAQSIVEGAGAPALRIATFGPHAGALVALGRLHDAAATYREGRALLARMVGPDHPDAFNAVTTEAHALVLLDRLDEAGDLLHEAVPRARKTLGTRHPVHAALLQALGEVEDRRGRRAAALSAMAEARTAYAAAMGPGSGPALLVAVDEARLRGRDEDVVAAAGAARKALDATGDLVSLQDVEQSEAEALLRLGRARDAATLLEASLARGATLDLDPAGQARGWTLLSRARATGGTNFPGAREALATATARLGAAPDPSPAIVREVRAWTDALARRAPERSASR